MTFIPGKYHRLTLVPLAASLAVLSGCATFSQDGGMGAVSDLTEQRTGQAVTRPLTAQAASNNAERVSALLKQPLDPNTVVQIALLNNRGLQASFAELGVAGDDPPFHAYGAFVKPERGGDASTDGKSRHQFDVTAAPA